MEIKLNKAQIGMGKEARRFLRKDCPPEFVFEMYSDEKGYTDELWEKMIENDWMAMRVPEKYGGMGMDLLDINIVLEEMGRAVLPGPFFSTVMLAAEAIMEAGSEAQKAHFLAAIADGKLKGTLALSEQDSGGDIAYIQLEARKEGDGYVLNGAKIGVPDVHAVDIIVVAARTQPGDSPEAGITLFVIDAGAAGVSITPVPTMDGSRKLGVVEFDNAKVGKDAVLGEPDQGWNALRRVLRKAQIGLCAECVGGAQRAMEIATDYAKVRVQYDQPIGAFQAVKHRCAEMFVDVESSRSILYYASWAQDNADEKQAEIAASVAKSYCTEAYTRTAGSGIQVLGGTGFTTESEMHLFLKRAKANEFALGDPAFHREQVMRLLT